MQDISLQEMWLRIKLIISLLGGAISGLVGGMDGLMTVLLACMVIDYLTGVMHAILERQLSSAVGFKGICKKVLIFVMVGAAHLLDIHILGMFERTRCETHTPDRKTLYFGRKLGSTLQGSRQHHGAQKCSCNFH